jgi:hypothetical protein
VARVCSVRLDSLETSKEVIEIYGECTPNLACSVARELKRTDREIDSREVK